MQSSALQLSMGSGRHLRDGATDWAGCLMLQSMRRSPYPECHM